MDGKKEQTRSEKLFAVKLTHEYWGDGSYIDGATGELVENRIPAGTVIEVPMDEALRLFEAKKAERADPLPS